MERGRQPTMEQIAQLLGIKVPKPGRRGDCPFRTHRRDKPFSVWENRETGEQLYKCHSCSSPGNVGGPVALYVRVTGLSYGEAYKELRERGLVDEQEPRKVWTPSPQKIAKPPIPNYGRRIDRLDLDVALWEKWHAEKAQSVHRFAEQRHIRVQTLLEHDVVSMGPRAVGFTYRDPEDGRPCRVKVRMTEEKKFWVEPKRDEDGRQAYAPLYLADKLNGGKVVVITEGEVDALTLVDAGVPNVVSLPDGTESASTVSVEPLDRYPIWLIAVDADAPGAHAHRVLFDRARRAGAACGRLLWMGNKTYKDANDAAQDGMPREWFKTEVKKAIEQTIGYELDLEGT